MLYDDLIMKLQIFLKKEEKKRKKKITFDNIYPAIKIALAYVQY